MVDFHPWRGNGSPASTTSHVLNELIGVQALRASRLRFAKEEQRALSSDCRFVSLESAAWNKK